MNYELFLPLLNSLKIKPRIPLIFTKRHGCSGGDRGENKNSLRKKIEKPFLAFGEARKSARALTKRQKKFVKNS